MQQSRATHRLGYLVPEFPGQTHIFFWREIRALRDAGAHIRLISTRLGPIDKVKHSFVPAAVAETYYLFPVPLVDALLSSLFMPLWVCRALAYCLSLPEGGWKMRLKVLAMLPCAAALLSLARREQLTHIHGHSCADSAHILALASLSGLISYSLSLHGDLPVYGLNHRTKMRRASFVAAVTQPLRQQLVQDAGVDPAKAHVVWMGVDMDKFQAMPVQTKTGHLRLISIARLAQCKGHTFALQALERLAAAGYTFTYTIIGGGEGEAKLKAEVLRRGLHQHVVFTGTLGEDEILAHLREADVLLLTSVGYGEAAPVCIMEAMASGRPVISSRIGGTHDMVQHGVNGYLVGQGQVDEIFKALVQLAEEPSLRLSMAGAARAQAEQLFSASKQAQRLLDLVPRPKS